MSDQVTLKQPLWTLEEEILLINSREATEKVVTYREVHHQIPHRSVHACLVHYGAIRKRELTADQLICIGELWSTLVSNFHVSLIFLEPTRLIICGVVATGRRFLANMLECAVSQYVNLSELCIISRCWANRHCRTSRTLTVI